MFRGIASDDFPPFGEFEIDLPPAEGNPDLAEVHLFTGVNGTGKTRLLAVLAAALGVTTPLEKRLRLKRNQEHSLRLHEEHGPLSVLANRERVSLSQSPDRAPADAWYLSVPAFAYGGGAYVRDVPITILADVPKPSREECLAFSRPGDDSQQLLQAVANLKVQAAMDSMHEEASRPDQPRALSPSHTKRIVDGMEAAISRITGRKFTFAITSYPKPSIGVVWGGVTMAIDSLPDGLRSIIGWLVHAIVMMDAWLLGESTPMESEAVFLLDEIESHLHPAWQRRILPAFQRLFPKAQIFVATHSPFIIASLNHGWIHPLTLDEDGRVTVEQPVKASAGDSYVSVLEDIMGLKEWYDPETEQLLANFRAQRDAAFQGGDEARNTALRLAEQIGGRSMELHYMMGREVAQMERQLARTPAKV
ncbi:MAG: ATP-binding protein [Verrucomicrobiales bacterium]|nr:ATP-binding protein [Verrucomicrobiales bacterium]